MSVTHREIRHRLDANRRAEADRELPRGDPASTLGRRVIPHPDGCWLWDGEPDLSPPSGKARAIWQILHHRRLPRSAKLHRTCPNRGCVHPDHHQPR